MGLANAAFYINWFFMVVPSYSLGVGFNNLYTNYQALEVCTPKTIAMCPILPNLCCKSKFQLFFLSRSILTWSTRLGSRDNHCNNRTHFLDFVRFARLWKLWSFTLRWIQRELLQLQRLRNWICRCGSGRRGFLLLRNLGTHRNECVPKDKKFHTEIYKSWTSQTAKPAM